MGVTDMTRLQDLQEQLDDLLNLPPETGRQWADVCWLEAEIIREQEQEGDDNSQFGMGA